MPDLNGSTNDLRPSRSRRRVTWLSLAGLAVCLGLAASPSVAGAAPGPTVVDFARAGCDYGCTVTRPARWLPDREPRQGLGVGFYQLRWTGWGTRRALASGVVRSCAQSDCRRGRVRIAVYKPAQTVNGFVYSCLRFKYIPVEPYLRGSTADIDADIDHQARC